MITIAKLEGQRGGEWRHSCGKGTNRRRKEGRKETRGLPSSTPELGYTAANRTTRIFCNVDDVGTISPRLWPPRRQRKCDKQPTRTYPHPPPSPSGNLRKLVVKEALRCSPTLWPGQEIPPMGGNERRKLPARLIHFNILQTGEGGGEGRGYYKSSWEKLYQFNGFATCIRGGGEKSFRSRETSLPPIPALSITLSRRVGARTGEWSWGTSRPSARARLRRSGFHGQFSVQLSIRPLEIILFNRTLIHSPMIRMIRIGCLDPFEKKNRSRFRLSRVKRFPKNKFV